MIIDRLYENVEKKGFVCLGLDTSPAYIPQDFLAACPNEAEAVFAFNKRIIDATADIVACYKVQIAYYEALGLQGLAAYKDTLRYIKAAGQLSIADIKRGDIKETAAMYAKAHFSGDFEADMVTLNPFMGMDTLEPYESYFANGKGCFALTRTSNKGADDVERLTTRGGERVFEVLGGKLMEFGKKYIGERGYSAIGAVVGAADREEGGLLRRALGSVFFLIPGFGAQGGTADDVVPCLENGNGGVVNSSRGILTSYMRFEDGAAKFELYARSEALAMNDKIRHAALL